MTPEEKVQIPILYRKKGMTYAKIAEKFGVSRQRIHQLMPMKGRPGRTPREIRPCEVCGKQTVNARFCSRDCFRESMRRKHRRDAICEVCGAAFMPLKREVGRFCSQKCRWAAMRKKQWGTV